MKKFKARRKHAVRTIEGGTPRAHIIDTRIHDGCCMEHFSQGGSSAAMIHSNQPYDAESAARVGARRSHPIYNLTKMGVCAARSWARPLTGHHRPTNLATILSMKSTKA